jgi:hypothetical protein
MTNKSTSIYGRSLEIEGDAKANEIAGQGTL